MTIAEKLQKIINIKSNIKNSIIAKGVPIEEGTPFEEYSNKINEIAATGSKSTPVIGVPTWEDYEADVAYIENGDFTNAFNLFKSYGLKVSDDNVVYGGEHSDSGFRFNLTGNSVSLSLWCNNQAQKMIIDNTHKGNLITIRAIKTFNNNIIFGIQTTNGTSDFTRSNLLFVLGKDIDTHEDTYCYVGLEDDYSINAIYFLRETPSSDNIQFKQTQALPISNTILDDNYIWLTPVCVPEMRISFDDFYYVLRTTEKYKARKKITINKEEFIWTYANPSYDTLKCALKYNTEEN